MMNCEEVQEYLSDLLDKTLAVDRAVEIKDHLNSCSLCTEEMARLAECQRLVSSLPAVDPPAGFATRVMAKVREAENSPGLWQRLFFPFQIRIPLQATAVVLIAVLAAYVYQKESLEHESEVTFQPESSFDKQKAADNLTPSVTQALSADSKKKRIDETTNPRVEEFKDSAPGRKLQPLGKPREQDKNIAGSLQEKASAASEGGSRRLEQSSPSAEAQANGVTEPAQQLEAENVSKDAALAGKPSPSPAAPRSAAPSLDSIRPSRGVGVALPVDHELAIRLKDPVRDDQSTEDRVASGRVQANRRQLLTQEEANNLAQARERAIQTGQSQIVQITIDRNQYELFKKELADLGTLEMESSTSELKDGAVGKSSYRLRIKVTILPPIASQSPAPSQPSSR
jgi:hypothetical protein